MIFYLRLAECFFHGLHDSVVYATCRDCLWLINKLDHISVTLLHNIYIVVFTVMWSCSNKLSSERFSTERK